MSVIFLVISLVLNVVLGYIVYNLFKKNEVYENTIQEFYSFLTITLRNMRLIDERQMFENDDEVGIIFSQLTDTVNTLRPLLYETPDEYTNQTER